MEGFLKSVLEIRRAEKKNSLLSKELLSTQILLFDEFFTIQQKLFKNHFNGVLDIYYGLQEFERITIQSYFKSIHLLYTAHNLTLNGNYGAANAIIRHIFEFQLLGKYFSIKKGDELATRWLDQRQFDVYDTVIKRLNPPAKQHFHSLWIYVCNFTHATTASYQVGLDFQKNREQIFLTYHLLLLLLRCNYHLLNSCFINGRFRHRSEYGIFGDHRKDNQLLRKKASIIKKAIYNCLSPNGKNLIKAYESTWSFVGWCLTTKAP